MVNYTGRYELQTNKNVTEYLKAMCGHVDDELYHVISKFDGHKSIVEVKVEGDYFTVKSGSGFTSTFIPGEVFEFDLAPGMAVQCATALAHNILTMGIKVDDWREIREYIFNDSHLVIKYTGNFCDITATRRYARIHDNEELYVTRL